VPIVGGGNVVLAIALLIGLASPPVSATGSTATSSVVPAAAATVSSPVLPGTDRPAFPADDVWNTPITDLPVSANSATWLASIECEHHVPPP
jgi:hypothetical protein